MKQIAAYTLAAFMGGLISLGGGKLMESNPPATESHILETQNIPSQFVRNAPGTIAATAPFDFREAAETALPAVVHIKSTKEMPQQARGQGVPDFFRDFFGDGLRMQPQNPNGEPFKQQGSGSGVIISPDGYIVTNNHVVEDATELEVTLHDNRIVKAEVIGTDPSTDLALIHIDIDELNFISLTNSDDIEVGEWVVAVGNPFNLANTVTAGIVSAKGRNLNILEDQAPIESFIQTDAAVNPGNSGGALVNLNGGLVGINTAIASPTGAYAGYAFAVPSNIVAKVVTDLKEFGIVQRAFLGAMVRTMDSRLADELDIDLAQGVYLNQVTPNGAAESAGLVAGDIITAIEGKKLHTSSELIEQIGRHSPGDKVEISLLRDGKAKSINVELKNQLGTTEVVKADGNLRLEALGATFEALSREELDQLHIPYGVRVEKLKNGLLKSNTDIREGFVIMRLNNQPVKDVKAVEELLSSVQAGGIMIEGKYPGDSKNSYYAFGVS